MKRSRQLEKENKFEQFKRQQKLHPEFAGIYADAFLATPQEVHFFRELLVFNKKVCVDSIVGVVQIQPHTTMRELRLLLRDEPTWVSQPVGPPVACPACLVRPTADLACRCAWAGLLGCAHEKHWHVARTQQEWLLPTGVPLATDRRGPQVPTGCCRERLWAMRAFIARPMSI